MARVISHYAYDRQLGRTDLPFDDWIRGDMANYQVRWIAGEEDLARAKHLLGSFALVGLQEHFRESLVLLKHLVFGGDLRIAAERRVNATKSVHLKEEIQGDIDRHRAVIAECCRLDLELYDFARDHLWADHVGRFGEARMARSLTDDFAAGRSGRGRRMLHGIHRTAVYKPVLCVARLLGVRR